MRLLDLPDDVLRMVLNRAMVQRDGSRLPFKQKVPLISVCRLLRHLALPMAYKQVLLWTGNRSRLGWAGPCGGSPSIVLASSAGCLNCVKGIQLAISCGYNPMDGINEAIGILSAADIARTRVKQLEIAIYAVNALKYDLGLINQASVNATIGPTCGSLFAMLPGVVRLKIAALEPNTVITSFCQQAIARYADQLKALTTNIPVATLYDVELGQLRDLELDWAHNHFMQLPLASAARLKTLHLRNWAAVQAWVLFNAGNYSQAVAFPNLTDLSLKLDEPAHFAHVDFHAHHVYPNLWSLRFPNLKRASICSKHDCLPTATWLVLPPRLDSLHIDVPIGMLNSISSMRLPTARQLTLVVPHESESAICTTIVVERIIRKMRECERVELHVHGGISHIPMGPAIQITVTHLRVGCADMEEVFYLAWMLLRLKSLRVENVLPHHSGINMPALLLNSIPPPSELLPSDIRELGFDDHPPPGPVSNSIEQLELNMRERSGDMHVLTRLTQLLEGAPSLRTVTIAGAPEQLVAQYVDAHSDEHPRLACVSCVSFL